jgi:hypothetical protein
MLPQLPQDKANHAVYGAAIFLAASLFGHLVHVPYTTDVALLVTAAAGALKELSDYILNKRAISQGLPPPHGVEFLDFLATTCGGAACWIASVM